MTADKIYQLVLLTTEDIGKAESARAHFVLEELKTNKA
jgi:hypothetical protein